MEEHRGWGKKLNSQPFHKRKGIATLGVSVFFFIFGGVLNGYVAW